MREEGKEGKDIREGEFKKDVERGEGTYCTETPDCSVVHWHLMLATSNIQHTWKIKETGDTHTRTSILLLLRLPSSDLQCINTVQSTPYTQYIRSIDGM